MILHHIRRIFDVERLNQRANGKSPTTTWSRTVGTAVICGYVFLFRIHDLDETFWLYSEQVRDWLPTQLPLADLPLVGPRSLNSGLDIGPAYYGFLWIAHALLSPFLGSFPHVGGIAIAAVQTIADLALLMALCRRLASWPLAAVAILLPATSPYDAGLTATIWNPPLAVAFAKFAMSALLWRVPLTTTSSALAVVCAWIAVQMHATALTVAIPLTLWIAYRVGREPSIRRIFIVGSSVAVSIAIVFLPVMLRPLETQEGVGSSLTSVAADPLRRLRIVESVTAVAWGLDLILAWPANTGALPWVIIAGAAALTWRHRLTAVTTAAVLPLIVTVALFSLWQGRFGEYYWFLVIGPAAAICAIGLLTLLPSRGRTVARLVALALVIALQPMRMEFAWGTAFRLPAYGPLRRGVVALVASERPVRAVRTSFAIPEGVDPAFMLSLPADASLPRQTSSV